MCATMSHVVAHVDKENCIRLAHKGYKKRCLATTNEYLAAVSTIPYEHQRTLILQMMYEQHQL
jgi:hypothetical protein